jgi:hypothetical protein
MRPVIVKAIQRVSYRYQYRWSLLRPSDVEVFNDFCSVCFISFEATNGLHQELFTQCELEISDFPLSRMVCRIRFSPLFIFVTRWSRTSTSAWRTTNFITSKNDTCKLLPLHVTCEVEARGTMNIGKDDAGHV